jgi:hypothetical protein
MTMQRRFLAVSLSLLAIGFYTLLVGAGASVVRAAIMGVLGLFAVQLRPALRGLPYLEVIGAQGGYTLLHTEWNGWIELTTDGEQLWVQVERY